MRKSASQKNVNKNYIKLFTKSDATASFTNKRQMSEEEKKNKGSWQELSLEAKCYLFHVG